MEAPEKKAADFGFSHTRESMKKRLEAFRPTSAPEMTGANLEIVDQAGQRAGFVSREGREIADENYIFIKRKRAPARDQFLLRPTQTAGAAFRLFCEERGLSQTEGFEAVLRQAGVTITG